MFCPASVCASHVILCRRHTAALQLSAALYLFPSHTSRFLPAQQTTGTAAPASDTATRGTQLSLVPAFTIPLRIITGRLQKTSQPSSKATAVAARVCALLQRSSKILGRARARNAAVTISATNDCFQLIEQFCVVCCSEEHH